jgi:hypothetical protein
MKSDGDGRLLAGQRVAEIMGGTGRTINRELCRVHAGAIFALWDRNHAAPFTPWNSVYAVPLRGPSGWQAPSEHQHIQAELSVACA